MSDTILRKAIIYCRVSSIRQSTEGHGLDSQESRCRDYAINRGYEIAAVFTDDVSGGGDFMKRPGMVRLLNYLDKHSDTPHVVIFDDLKRYARDTIFHLKLRQEMSARNATRECLNFKFEDSPEGEFIETILAAQGQLERQQNSRQVIQKMKARVLNGYYCFYPPPGYKYEKVRSHGKLLVRDEPLASVVQEGLEGFASGRFESQTELLRFFDNSPIFPRSKTGNVHVSRVKEILTRITYAGYIEVEDWGIAPRPAQHEGLISYATFLKIQDRLTQTAKAPARKDLNIHFPLRNFVLCGDCGSPLTACMSKGRNGHHPYYLCHRKGCESYKKSIRRDVIEGEFETLLTDMQPSADMIATAKKMLRMIWDYRQKSGAALANIVKKELVTLDRGIEQLLDKLIEASSPTVISAYEKRIDSMEKQKLVLQEKLVKKSQPVHDFDTAFRTALQILSNPLKIWHLGQFEHKRMLLRIGFADKLTYVRNEGFRTAEIAQPFRALRHFANDNCGMVEVSGIEPLTPCVQSKCSSI